MQDTSNSSGKQADWVRRHLVARRQSPTRGLPPPARNFQQTQPITTSLRLICESYPANTCLRELLQNADDAAATEIEYVLDTRTYYRTPLLYDELQQYHGPALLVRNNSVFTDNDFVSLSSVGDSLKRSDPTTTGKFGQGFNSVSYEEIMARFKGGSS